MCKCAARDEPRRTTAMKKHIHSNDDHPIQYRLVVSDDLIDHADLLPKRAIEAVREADRAEGTRGHWGWKALVARAARAYHRWPEWRLRLVRGQVPPLRNKR